MMRTSALSLLCLATAWSIACGTQGPDNTFGRPSGSTSTLANASGGGFSSGFSNGGGGFGSLGGGSSAGSSSVSDAGSTVCDDAGHCNCADGSTTTIEGTVFDPAGKNPLYNVSVYVPDPAAPLPALDSVGLTCGCKSLYPATVLALSSPTDPTGHFRISCAPSGTVSLVVQTGKWRMRYDGISVVANQTNTVPNLRLPANSAEGSLPDIAIATGGADSLECLPLRIGVSASEYTLGAAAGGHIHIYTGFGGATMQQGSVAANQMLWDQQSHLNQHDVVLLSCEGHETTGGNPGAALTTADRTLLLNYASAGGRVFASHFHYAWFNAAPFNVGANQLATWITGGQQINDNTSFPSDVDTTLSGGAAFPEGAALEQWLNGVGALTNNQLPVWFARHNVQALLQPPSTEWIHLDPSVVPAPSATQYFSADTPIGASAEAVCGRIVYSDLHVSGGPGMNAPGVPPDYPNPGRGGGRGGAGGQGALVPSGCAAHPLTPQEEALEFMLFDLSSCLVPPGQTAPPQPPVRVP